MRLIFPHSLGDVGRQPVAARSWGTYGEKPAGRQMNPRSSLPASASFAGAASLNDVH
jgi:hypothetical protein